MKDIKRNCKEYHPYYIVIFAVYLILVSSYYCLYFETPTYRIYRRMQYSLNSEMNLTNVAQEFRKYNISIYIEENEMSFSFSGGYYDNKTLYPVEGKIWSYRGNDHNNYQYVVEIWLNKTEFPSMSFHDALQTKDILYASAVFIKNLIYDATGTLPVAASNITYVPPGGF